jgi:hypothetical protein
VTRQQSSYRNGEWTWTVRGGGPLRDHLCDEKGKTHKRAVEAVLVWLGKKDEGDEAAKPKTVSASVNL